jgi:hypothetical protein
VPRLIAFFAALVALLVPATAQAAPVNPTPVPSATFDGNVRSVVYWGNVIYLAGDFANAKVNGIRYPRARLAAVDSRNGALLDWAPTADGSVAAIAADASGVYIAGDFNYVNGVARDSLAKLSLASGRLLSGFSHRIYGHPKAIAAAFGRVYLGGSLTNVDGQVRNRLAAFSASTGALDLGWLPSASDAVMSILPAPDRLYLGGRFDNVNGVAGTQKIAAVDLQTGAVIPTFVSRVFSLVHVLAISNGSLYVGIDGNGGHAAALDAATGALKWTVTTDGDVQAVAVLDDTVYVGGHFDNFCRSNNVGDHGVCLDGSDPRVKLAAVDLDGNLLDWHADANGIIGVQTLAADPVKGQLVAGGEFSTINGLAQRKFAVFTLPVTMAG